MSLSLDLLTANDRKGQHAASYYAATATRQTDHPALAGDTVCDVCVIGGGYTGLSSALHLAERGYKVVLLEANRIGWGASGRNGGQVGTGQRVDQTVLEKRHGLDQAKVLWQLGLDSMDVTMDLIKRHGIACDYTPGVLHADHRKDFVPETRDYVERLQSVYGYDKIRFIDENEMHQMVGSPAYHGGSLDMGSGHVHPLNLALGLGAAAEKAGATLHEMTRVEGYETSSDGVMVTAAGGTVKAKHLVLACNGYLGKLDRKTAAHVMPINNFIVASEPLSEDDAKALIRDNVAVADSKFVINYFRLSADRRMLFGGGESYGYKFPDDIRSFVRKPMCEIYPQLKDVRLDYGWGGTLAITVKRMPYFSRVAPNVLSAGGYSGHGVAMATFAGKVLAEAIDGTASRFDAFADLKLPSFPGGSNLRHPILMLAMSWFALRDKLGI
ncbi:FAD-binding oxidoreductase [Roseibium sp. CAU 1637]|uniref:FAD-binding oxidoreductase n=1 Tax=Roseibium limicola TaxID=2816037 RepID=A0A939EJE5_9HYPH|nr:FAD-binding oxidoreductase [Roseibium limicola]MBO0343750.1 FAD-binding oxidoreductase [Roseibium limicola]